MSERELFVIFGPSGTGKNTIIQGILHKRPDIHLAVSHTTRQPRSGEVDRVHYHFIARWRFRLMITLGLFLEWAQYPPAIGQFYGTAKSEVRGKTTLMEIELQGARGIRRKYPGAKLIFIEPPSIETLRARIRKRGAMSEEDLAGRLAQAEVELAEGPLLADHVIRNPDGGVEQAVREILVLMS